jgi:siroheme synthase
VLGRGGEDAEALRQAGIDYEIIPGVSSAFAAPAAAGIPVTHRGLATSVTVVTGTVGGSAPGKGVDWRSLGQAGGTLVVLMGMSERADIARELMQGGRPPDTPVAVVHWGATARQQVARSTLDRLAAVDLPPPAAIVIGPVAALDLGPGREGQGRESASRPVSPPGPRSVPR